MFAKTGKTPSPPTIIARGCKILGDIHHLGELHLEGEVVGSLHCDRLVICDGASVCGDIDGKAVTIAGKVNGQVNADSVDIGATAQIDGDIRCNQIAIARGARVEGKIHRRQTSTAVVETMPSLLSLAIST
ncbi:MAG TPA: polymer-forming cytoskeletal protein [Rhodospirillaceae bacterium]|nr:polymer-forming cytoskeletal protein [Rhodospirillaceae bacterium]